MAFATIPVMSHDLPPELSARARLVPAPFDALPGWRGDNHLEGWRVFAEHCRAIGQGLAPLRKGAAASAALLETCEKALILPQPKTRIAAQRRFEALFEAFAIEPVASANPYDEGFLTGYYEPVVAGSLTRSARFSEPVLGRPSDLVTLSPEEAPPGLPPGLAGARRMADGSLAPYAERSAIENCGDAGDAGDAQPLLWVRDGIELFMMQVQGSARIRLPDGSLLRLTYAGRNGQPYTSIGRLLVERGEIPASEMSLARLKDWVRRNGQKPGEAGRQLMQENKSYIFFRLDGAGDAAFGASSGPIGAASLPLTRLRSIAVDRTLWPYGLPMWIDAELAWRGAHPEPFRRLMVAQDTGSAILGAARADIFFGTGARAGRLAGGIRHKARMYVLLPRENAP